MARSYHVTAKDLRRSTREGIPNAMKYFLLPILLLAACTLGTKKTGMHQCSQSIEASKANGVFRYALRVDDPVISIGDNKTDTVKQIWVEDMWRYESENSGTIIKKDSTRQVLIRFGQLSARLNDTIYLKHHGDYFGWNGVLFSAYHSDNDTVLVVKKVNTRETIIDTLVYGK